MKQLFQLLETVAPTNSTILITGETGTRQGSRRARDPPQQPAARAPVRRAELQRDSGDAARGGALRPRARRVHGRGRQPPGTLEQAHKGTLFLDEVGTMSAALQMKLLRVLQEREFERVGDSHTIKVDVRVIAATNSDLGRLVAEGQFREDLFYRLNVIPVQLPPLRERKEDVPLLVQHFLGKFQQERSAGGEAMRQATGARPSADSVHAADRVAGRHAPADGVSLAGQRPPARERHRARGGVHGRTIADRRRRSADRDPAGAGTARVVSCRHAARRRRRSRRVHRQHRARADPAIARAHRRQQRAGGATAELEAHDARREAQASRQSERNRRPSASLRHTNRTQICTMPLAGSLLIFMSRPNDFTRRKRASAVGSTVRHTN